jgi:hypothetical protein
VLLHTDAGLMNVAFTLTDDAAARLIGFLIAAIVVAVIITVIEILHEGAK